MPTERISRILTAFPAFPITLVAAGIAITIADVLVRALPMVAWTASKYPRVIVIAFARPRSMLISVVISLAIV